MTHPAEARSGGPDLSMVVPTYNERDGIGALTDAVLDACARRGIDVEIIIVDDNSPDGTGAVADELARTRPVRVIHRSGKLGLGTAVMAGFEAAAAPVVGVMDADFSHPPRLVPDLLDIIRRTGADVVVASRYIRGGSTPNWPFKRRLLSRVGCLMARPLSPIRDGASGFFVIRREVTRNLSIRAGGFKICLEIIVRAWPRHLVEVPYRFDDRELGESKMSLREALGYLVQLRQLYRFRFVGAPRSPRRYEKLSPEHVAVLTTASAPMEARSPAP